MNEIKVFSHPNFGNLEIWIRPDGRPWFPATESAEMLKYADPYKAISTHTKPEGWANRPVLTPGGVQQKKYINRPNLSRLIARSHLPEAAKFESWIFDDVLESVFDHGIYAAPQTIEEMLEDPDAMIQALQSLKAEREKRKRLEAKVDEDAPKVIFADSVTASQTSILIGELAKILKQNGVNTGQNRLFEWLRVNGYLINRKGTDFNMPTQYSMELGLFEIKETSITHGDGHISVSKTPKVTGKGQVYFINRIRTEAI